ncbi:S1/P1 nuclease-like protein [Amylocarpus encephaloides]|uniref:S1/P1 nuclease-like protein n=1 Tax=Amylocarpus encephaloides TaxID=45428 RepID=A0A9P8C4N6_9HELO|nr:S1/P1 nuclease-like protein [Amylocarpus encephaloides]
MKFSVTTLPALLLASTLPGALGWGALGHYTVAYVASHFVTNKTKQKFQRILGDDSTDYLAAVAAYPDTYRNTAIGAFTAPFHYIDALDAPPDSCNVDFARDCGIGGCIVSAISNYTTRVQSKRLAAEDVKLAAEMIIHFLGDIHQPLHVENLELGGNGIKVTFGGVATNLHAVWDTSIPQKYAGNATLAHAAEWATILTAGIKKGPYKRVAASWLKGMTLKDPVKSAMTWATDSNSYVCSAVLPDGRNATETIDLSGEYYTETLPIVQIQIAKAGYRLAGWLNLIASGKTCL